MRIIIDGTVGAGKTTLITGMSNRNSLFKSNSCLCNFGYKAFTDWITMCIADLRKRGIEDPSDNWNLFFEEAIKKSIENYQNALLNTISFYDRSIHYLEIMSKRYGIKLPDSYFDFCSNNRYDNPVLLFEPIPSIDMTKPQAIDNKQKIYTVEERIKQHNDLKHLYQKWNYEVIEVPLGSEDINESHMYRLDFVRKVLKI